MILKILYFILFFFTCTLKADEFYYEFGKRVEVKQMLAKSIKSTNANKYYMNTNGHIFGVNNEIIIKCKKSVNCQKTLKNYDLESVENLSKELYLLKINKDESIFKFCVKLYNDENIEMAHPNFIKQWNKR